MADGLNARGATTLAPGAAAPDADRTRPGLLRFLTCGSVDDGKSTLIGRLLFEAQLVLRDQLAALEADSRRAGRADGTLDLSLLCDGLAAEREQGITIDVAYRLFATPRRRFIVADAPGHEQYTRNMVTAASNADLAVLLVDARKGLLTQTRRHAYLAALLGIRQVVLAVNKMDAVGFDPAVFTRIAEEFAAFAQKIGIAEVRPIPLSALHGDNVTRPSERTPFYDGPTLLSYLEDVVISSDAARLARPLRLPVQWVTRAGDLRGFAGLLQSGAVSVGQRVRVQPSGRESRVERIVTFDGDLDRAEAGQSITVTLQDQVDVARGDLLAAADDPATVAAEVSATLVWFSEDALEVGRPYLLKSGARTVTATVTALRHRTDVNTLAEGPASALAQNEIGRCELRLDQPLVFDPYDDDRATGGFLLIDRLSNDTVGAGLLRGALRRAAHIHWHALDVDPAARAAQKGQRPAVLWFTGLSGAGKSTIANLVERRLLSLGRHSYVLDGDNLRHGLCRDLGFSPAERAENIRRVAEVARLFADAGLIVLVSLISPFAADRRLARERAAPASFVEVFVDAPLSVVEGRDPKGLYRKARRGELRDFTGIDSPYEAPAAPELRLDTAALGPEAAAEAVVAYLRDAGLLSPLVRPEDAP